MQEQIEEERFTVEYVVYQCHSRVENFSSTSKGESDVMTLTGTPLQARASSSTSFYYTEKVGLCHEK